MSKTLVKTVKRRLKNWLKERRRRFIKRFFHFDKAQLSALISRLDIQPGDVLLVHVGYDKFEGFEGGPGDVIEILQNAIGASGTLIMPTIPFRGSAIDYARTGQMTDLVWSPSAVGLVTEVFRRMPDVLRSVHPTHPVAAWGAHASELIRNHHLATTPCGKNTPFLGILEFNGKILFLGTGIGPMTFFHGVEEILEPQMPYSPFTAASFELQTRDAEGKIWTTTTRLFEPSVSRRRDLESLVPILKQNHHWRQGRSGRLSAIVVSAREVLKTCQQMAAGGRFCYRPN